MNIQSVRPEDQALIDAAKAVAAAEMLDFGEAYAQAVVRHAQALAQALYEEGLDVLCEEKGFTESHQVVIDVSGNGGGKLVAGDLEAANVICNKNLLPWDPIERSDDPSGIRIGVAELTRLGMQTHEMAEVAAFYRRVILSKEDPSAVAADVTSFRSGFQDVHFGYRWEDI